jgi:hypothetical protein
MNAEIVQFKACKNLFKTHTKVKIKDRSLSATMAADTFILSSKRILRRRNILSIFYDLIVETQL